MATLAIAGLWGCNIAEVGGPEPTSCELATQHVASCLGLSDVQVSTNCDAQAAAQADAVLQKQCSELSPAGVRSTQSFQDLLCQLLPFMCSLGTGNPGPGPGNPGPGNVFRIGDCWRDAQFGFCYDIAKFADNNNCTTLMDRPEWQQPHYSRWQCLQPYGDRCRLVRVCQQFQDKGQCINSVPHRNDARKCQAAPTEQPPGEHPGEQPPEQPPSGPNSCNSDAPCGGGVCLYNHQCAPKGSLPEGTSCRDVNGTFRPALCQPGLACRINVSPGHSSSECVVPTPWP